MKINRWSLLMAWFIGLISSDGITSSAAETPTNRLAIISGPILQSATETTMTVTWITDRNSTALVEYGPVDGELGKAFSSHHGLIDANERVHQVVLSNLRPGQLYRYRVVSTNLIDLKAYKVVYGDTAASPFRQFHVFDRRKTDFSFLVYNDVHGLPATVPDLLQVAGSKSYDFVVLNGDILSFIEEESQINSILNQCMESFAATIPLFWVRGNHETRGGLARRFSDYLGSPNGRYYYSFAHGPAHFIILDTGEDKIDGHIEYGGLADFFRYREEQAQWLKDEVKSKAFRRAKYRIVLCHMPFASQKAATLASTDSVFTGMAHAFAQFGKTLDKAGVDLMIAAHTHFPAIIKPESGWHKYPIIQGGGDKTTNRTIIRVDVRKTDLDATILRADGSIVGTCRIPAQR